MNKVSEPVKKFFQEYEKSNSIFDLEGIDKAYSDSFLFADPSGVKPPLKKDAFLTMLPKRREFFNQIGLKSRNIVSLEEIRLDEQYIMVKTQWTMHFEKEGQESITDEILATYILYKHDDLLQIVFQIDHQDFIRRVEELGLVQQK